MVSEGVVFEGFSREDALSYISKLPCNCHATEFRGL